MPRELCVGNGDLLLALDENLSIRDLYYPYVGMENHVSGHSCRFGVWVDGAFSWIDSTWEKKFGYRQDSLVTEVIVSKPGFPLTITVNDGVHHLHSVFLRRVTVKSTADRDQEVRVFFSHDLHIGDSDKGVTAYYHPELDAVIHFRKDRFFLMSGLTGTSGLSQYAVGVTEFGGHEGTYKDAEDGELSKNPVAHGSVDSVIGFTLRIPPKGEATLHSWICAGHDILEVSSLHKNMRATGPEVLLNQTEEYYRLWVNKSEITFGKLSPAIIAQFKRSLLTLRTQIDNRGGIIASCDSDILRFNKDTYSYIWPRDGAFVAMGLDAAGYHHVTRRFFEYCKRAITAEGFLFQKYNPDGTWGSTWHPWIDKDGHFQYPIQEDETALVLFTLWNHYDQVRDIEFISALYEPLICHAADFLVKYRDSTTNLPLPSYDLWEENHAIFTFTVSAVFGGLMAASRFAALLGDGVRAETYSHAAGEVKEATLAHLYDSRAGRFLKSISPDGKGGFTRDYTIDSSIYGIFEFGVLPPNDARVKSTMQAVESTLWVKTSIGGCARYEKDYYQRVGEDYANVPGNPWPICTLWLAEWYFANKELEKGIGMLSWVVDRASQAGILAEQVDPYTGAPLSVSPLTWSHSTFVLTIIRYLNLIHDIKICPKCGLSLYRGSHERPWF